MAAVIRRIEALYQGGVQAGDDSDSSEEVRAKKRARKRKRVMGRRKNMERKAKGGGWKRGRR